MNTVTTRPTLGSLLAECDLDDGCWRWRGDVDPLPVLPDGSDVRRYVMWLFTRSRSGSPHLTSTCGDYRCIRPTHMQRGRSAYALVQRLKQADDPHAEAATWNDEDWYITADNTPTPPGKLRCAICDRLLSEHTTVFGTCFHRALIAQADDAA